MGKCQCMVWGVAALLISAGCDNEPRIVDENKPGNSDAQETPGVSRSRAEGPENIPVDAPPPIKPEASPAVEQAIVDNVPVTATESLQIRVPSATETPLALSETPAPTPELAIPEVKPALDMATAVKGIDTTLNAISKSSEVRLSQKFASPLSAQIEGLSRLAQEPKYTNEQRQRVGELQEEIDKLMSQALRATDLQTKRQVEQQMRARFQELRGVLRE